jgi:hypothetical protein
MMLLAQDAVTGTLLRTVPVETYVKRARNLVALELAFRPDGSVDVERAAAHGAKGLRELEEAYEHRAKPRRGARLPDPFLRQVADVYRDALGAKRPPTKEVMLQLHTSRSNAGRWVAEARGRGFLPKTQPRKARA